MKKELNTRRNLLVKAVTVFVLFAMAVTAVMPVPAVKAVTKQTMYVGEKFEYVIYGATVTGVSSSSKKVVKTAKAKGKNNACTLEAKKTGSATVTIKYKDYSRKTHTKKLKITVKKLDLTGTVKPLDSGYVLLEVKNNTKQTFDRAEVRYTLKNASGQVIKEDVERVNYVMAGKTAYDSIYVGRDQNIDFSQCEAKVTAADRDPGYTYKNVAKKNLTVTKMDEADDGTNITFKLRIKNKLNQNVQVVNYLISYDSEGNIIDMTRRTAYVNKKATETTSAYTVSKGSYSHPTFDHYELVTQAYTMERKK